MREVLQTYDQYKDSGIEWIGEIPKHWEVKRLKDLAEIQGGRDSKDVELEEGKYPIYGSGGIFGRASKCLHSKPSVLLGRKGTIDKPLFVTEPFWSVDTMFYTDIKKNVEPKFFYYQCLTIQFGLYLYGSAVPSMSSSVLKRLLLPVPPFLTQEAIAHYLDTKTAPNRSNYPNHKHPNRKPQRTPQNPDQRCCHRQNQGNLTHE